MKKEKELITSNRRSEIYNLVYDYPSKYPEGLLPNEVDELLTKNFPKLKRESYNEKMRVHTAMMVKEGIITYHKDIFYAVIATLENRGLNWYEFD